MASQLIFCSHPEVRIDPYVPVTRWGLSDMGRDRMETFASSPAVANVAQVVSSSETKALEAASVVAIRSGICVEVRADLGENDRTATGFVPPHEFEQLADAFFAEPEGSISGWETAAAAQARILKASADLVNATTDGDILIVAHGGVGTLLYCALVGEPISRSFDQPHQGCYFVIDRRTGQPIHRWKSIT